MVVTYRVVLVTPKVPFELDTDPIILVIAVSFSQDLLQTGAKPLPACLLQACK